MKNKIVIVLLAFVLIIPLVTVNAEVSVKVKKAVTDEIKEVSIVNGQVVPEKTIAVASKISAELEEVNVEMGQYVKKGEKLIVFEDDLIKAQLKQAEAAYEAAKAQHEMLIEGATKEDIKRAEESYNQAVASYEGAKESLKLVKKMYNDKTSLKQQLTNSEMQFENAKKQLESAKKRYEQSKVNLEQAEVNLDQAEKEYNRMKELYEDGVVTEKQFEMAESQYKNARLTVQNAESAVSNAKIAVEQSKISYEAAKESYKLTEKSFNDPTQLKQQLDSARTQLEVSRANKEIAKANLEKVKKGARQGEIDSSLASVKQAEASLEQAKLRMEDTVIKSPISGFIANVNAEEGQLVGQGTSLLNIVSLDPVYVQIDVSSSELININKGDKVKVDFLDYKELEKEGTVKMISPVRDQRSQLYPVKVKVENEKNMIKAGMFADVHFTLKSKENTVVVPVDSVIDLDGDPYVFAVENGKAIKKEVKIGLISKNEVEVISGIKSGVSVIVQGHNSLQDGDSVEVVNK